ncbi:amino acid ABC transporter permease [Moritella yayanosii]|uniref:Amino-acid transporter subunit membrane component of ABC superfamily n=1 Tax=Moritella yayanosii TaxID=69539 RepID=A0A330LV97_9GAMM|nr:ABC transporter permease subunit [Moritella yayanosii]SQD77965.1 amino-acid transporter subunit; membrane component of ABC superfamily [Moritella yayanosii]
MAINDDARPNKQIQSKEKFDFFQNERVRSFFYQFITAAVVIFCAWYLYSNTAHNLAVRDMSTGFDFLSVSAGFDPGFTLISYEPGIGTYADIYLIGILNTLFVSILAIIASTSLGFFIGMMRLSNNWLVSKVALAYVEIFRNIPLLIQLVFWYIAVFSILPKVRNSIDLSGGAEVILLNNRGLYMAWPVPGDLLWITGLALIIAVTSVVFLRRWAKKKRDLTGQITPTFIASLALLILLPGSVYLLTGSPLSWDIPKLEGFNFVGGAALPPAFLTLLVALSIYHSAYFAESVRAGILSVNQGQRDAAHAIGLKPMQMATYVIIPQAMPAIVPPMISLWMNTVKNSSLAIAIGYSDLVSLFMQTSLNQLGHAIEIVGMTMAFYMSISLFISWMLNIYNKRVQLVER